MRRHVLNIMAIGFLAVLVTGCSSELATTTAPNAEALAPRIGDGGLRSSALQEYVATCEWIGIDFSYPASGDSTITVVPEGYPAAQPLTIVIHRDPATDKPGDTGTLWLPAPPRDGVAPADLAKYVVFRTRNIPADASTRVDIHLPVTPWQDTVSWDGDFAMYRLGGAQAGWVAYADGGATSVQWPDGASYASLCLRLGALPDKDGTGAVVDQAVEPTTSGDTI